MNDCAMSFSSCASSETPRETAPCADPGTTTGWAVAPSTRETRRAHKPQAAAPDLSPRRRQADPAARAAPDPGAETNSDPPARPARPVCSESQLLIRRPVIRHVALYRRGVVIDAAGLASGEIANGRGKSLVGDEMRRTRQSRHESTRYLVFALRTRLEALQIVVDAILNSLVVAGLEMQAVVVAAGAPVAAEQGVVAHEKNRHGDRFAADTRHLQHELIRHRSADAFEEIQSQIRFMAVTMEGIGVKAIQGAPQ